MTNTRVHISHFNPPTTEVQAKRCRPEEYVRQILRTSRMSSHTVVAAIAWPVSSSGIVSRPTLRLRCWPRSCMWLQLTPSCSQTQNTWTGMLRSKPLVSTYRVLTTTEHGIFPFPEALLGLLAKNSRRWSSSHLTSSLLSPGPIRDISKGSRSAHRQMQEKLTTSPVTPNGREHLQLTDSRPHVLDFDFGILGSWANMSARCR